MGSITTLADRSDPVYPVNTEFPDDFPSCQCSEESPNSFVSSFVVILFISSERAYKQPWPYLLLFSHNSPYQVTNLQGHPRSMIRT